MELKLGADLYEIAQRHTLTCELPLPSIHIYIIYHIYNNERSAFIAKI